MVAKSKLSGKCRICLKYGKLTEDHVPPKGGIEVEPVEMENALDHLSGIYKERNFYISQNGVKFVSLCERCNNYELGKRFDPTLNEFAKEVGKYVNSKLYLPNEVLIETKPNAIIRAVLGHLLATKEVDDYGFDNDVREFLLDENKTVPNTINIFYWVYPYKVSVILRDFAMPAKRGKFSELGYFNLLKYFPIAYLLSDKDKYEGLYSLNEYRDLKPSETAEVPVRLNFKKNWLWPEAPEPDNFIIMGATYEGSVYATEKKKRKK